MPLTRKRYQAGTLQKVKRAKGPQMWVYRWRELATDGIRVQRKRTIGSVEKYKSESEARKAVDFLRLQINADVPATRPDEVWTFGKLWGHFQKYELEPEGNDASDNEQDEARRSPTTIEMYSHNMRFYVLPKWGNVPLDQILSPDVEAWLRSLRRKNGNKLAPGTKMKLRNQMSCIFNHALRHKRTFPAQTYNPITKVRQGGQRQRIPDIVTIEEIRTILSHVKSSLIRTVILVAAETGLRRSELRGLRWSSIQFDSLEIKVDRGVVGKHHTRGKTAESRKGTTMTRDLADMLKAWRESDDCLYRTDDDWVFASVQTSGRSPVWLDSALKTHVQAAAKEAGIVKRVGWHSLRHSLASLLVAGGENMKVVQALLRHKHMSTTSDLYTQGDADAKRAAQGKMKGLFVVKAAS